MDNTLIIRGFLQAVIDGLKNDATRKSQKIPVKSFRIEANADEGSLYGADYFKYLITGRGPGKFPPPDAMLSWVRANPQVLDRAKETYQYLTEGGLAYMIGRKIAREGTDIHKGKKPGIDFQGVVDREKAQLFRTLEKNTANDVRRKISEANK